MAIDESNATPVNTTTPPDVPAGETAQGEIVAVPLSVGGPLARLCRRRAQPFPNMPAGETAQSGSRSPRGCGRLAFLGLVAAVVVLGVSRWTELILHSVDFSLIFSGL
jgi:hypothetical protein